MNRLERSPYLNNFVTFFNKKCYWMGNPIIIIKYTKIENKFFSIVMNKDQYNSFNIFLDKDKYWESGKCRKPDLVDHINYLTYNLEPSKHEIIYNQCGFTILLFHPE